eukprot:1160313-Pleurochrysis_carterae.AAC.4
MCGVHSFTAERGGREELVEERERGEPQRGLALRVEQRRQRRTDLRAAGSNGCWATIGGRRCGPARSLCRKAAKGAAMHSRARSDSFRRVELKKGQGGRRWEVVCSQHHIALGARRRYDQQQKRYRQKDVWASGAGE